MSLPKRSKNNTNDGSNSKPPSDAAGSFDPYADTIGANHASSYDNYGRPDIHRGNTQESRPPPEYRDEDGYRDRSQERTDDFTEFERQDKTAMRVDDMHLEPYSWRHTCISNGKSLEKVADAHKYVTSLAQILQVPRTMDGESFITDLHQAIDDGTQDYCREYLINDEKTVKIYVVAGVRSLRGQKREVYYCLQKLTDPSMSHVNREGGRLNVKPTIPWFRRQAIDRLQRHANVIHASHSLPFDKRDGEHQNNTAVETNSNYGLFGSCRPS
ncbi:unnamed protein product [Sphagnum balticum]